MINYDVTRLFFTFFNTRRTFLLFFHQIFYLKVRILQKL